MVVLSDDMMTAESRKIPDIVVDITVVGGKVAYSRRGGSR
jgi:predicted amidohydrolase YtcJ